MLLFLLLHLHTQMGCMLRSNHISETCAECHIMLPSSQGEELEPVRSKAEQFGVKEIFIDDLREEFVRDFVFPMFR